jgi:hypothetical protein
MRRPKRLFISHAQQDVRFVAELAFVLEKHGIGAWYSDLGVRPGENWHDSIGRELRRCDWFAIVLSPAATKSKWTKHELIYALTHEKFKDRIVPVQWVECNPEDLSWTVAQLHQVRMPHDFEGTCAALLATWGIDLIEGAAARRYAAASRPRSQGGQTQQISAPRFRIRGGRAQT